MNNHPTYLLASRLVPNVLITFTTLYSLCLLSACVAYNDQCSADTSSIIGHSEVLFDIRPQFIRAREAPIGNLVADSIMRSGRGAAAEIPHFAIIDAGAFSTATACGTRSFIERGPISSDDISYLVGENVPLVIVELNKVQVKRMLERAVSGMGDTTSESEATQFLQVSAELNFEINCDNLPHQFLPDGEEFAGLRIDDSMVFFTDGSSEVDLASWPTERPIYIATTQNLADGAQDHRAIADGFVAREISKPLYLVVGEYIELKSPILLEDVITRTIVGQDNQQGRIRPWKNCFP